MTDAISESILRSRRSFPKRVLAALDPRRYFVGIPGPIFRKEMLVGSRRKSTYVLRGGFVLIVAFLMTFMLLVMLSESTGLGNVAKLQRFQSVAPAVTQLVCWCSFILLSLMAITRGAASISDERRMGTLSTLMTTPLNAWQIVVGKLFSATSELLIIGLSTIPILLAVRTLGGVTVHTVLIAALFTLLHSLMCATVSMSMSVSARSASVASVRGFLIVLGLQIGVPLAAMVLDSIARDVTGIGISTASARMFGAAITPESLFAVTLSPLNFAFAISGDSSILPAGATSGIVLINLAYMLCVSGCFFLGTVALLRRRLMRDAEGSAEHRATVQSQEQNVQSADGGTTTSTKSSKKSPSSVSRIVGDSPVMWRELQQRAFRRKRSLLGIAVLLCILLLWCYHKVGLNEQTLQLPVFVVASLGILAFAAASTTGSFASEREGRTWETLLTTPLTASAIVMGKFWGTLRRQWFVPAVLLAHGTISVAAGVLDPAIILVIPILLGPLLLFTSTGCLFGMIFKKGTIASTINFGLALAIFAFLPLFMAIAGEISVSRDLSEFVVFCLAVLNPVAMTGLTVDAVFRERWQYNGQMTAPFRVFGFGSLTTLQYTLLTLGVFLLYLGGTWSILKIASNRLARESGRKH